MVHIRRFESHLSRRYFLSGLAAATGVGAASVCLSGCSTNPATGRDSIMGFSSLSDDVRLGQQQYPNMIRAFGGVYDYIPLQSYVARIGRDLASQSELPELPWEFTVLNTPIVNALALPGGKIGITRGLLAIASNEAEVAGVLAHEIGHVTARHTAQRQTRGLLANLGMLVLGAATQNSQVMQLGQTVSAGYLQGFSRDQEFESDILAVRYMTRAGYDSDAMATFLASLREYSVLEARRLGLDPGTVDQRNMMASHPRTIERVQRAQEESEIAQLEDGRLGQEDYLTAINNMVYGDDPDQGFVRDRDFLHAKLRLAFRVPPQFTLRNGNSQVVAEDQNGGMIVFDAAQAERSRSLQEYIQFEWTEGVEMSNLTTFEADGMPAATGVGRLSTPRGTVGVRAVVVLWDGNQLYRFLYLAPARVFDGYERAWRDTTASFRRLSDSEAASLQPLRISVSRASSGASVEALSTPLPYGTLSADWFRMLNDLPMDQPIPNGKVLKLVRQ